ncbi:phosphotransferase family protein [Sciscionella sediminilitoris]|uniref:phosphotransferase family protein n=1 Tax=Sciscionella sediminilitoris TaxID=1445613 RepID=UPI0009EC4877|nr:phosphotransferase family protein [Sciscionella sp. SE31]
MRLLQDWLVDSVPGFEPPAAVRRMGVGQSNITSLIEDSGGHSWVLRHPPPGSHDPSAHDVHREARVLSALDGSPVPVPAVIATGSNEAGITTAFYVMQRVPGVVLASEDEAEGLSGSERLRVSDDVLGVLAALHAIRPDEIGLGDLGRTEGYLERQIVRTARSWDEWGKESKAAVVWERCRTRLAARMPAQQRTVIVHGDYRLSNLLVEAGKVTAVLDWELCTLGDPLADLAWLVDDWRSPLEPAIAIPSPTRVGGFHDREHLIAEYGQMTGLDVSEIGYYRAFTHWKAATLLQGVLLRRRTARRDTSPSESELETTIETLLDEALELMSIG